MKKRIIEYGKNQSFGLHHIKLNVIIL